MNRNKRRQLRIAAQQTQEQQTMSNSFETNEAQNNQTQEQAPANKPIGSAKRVLILRCRQAALDVVLDGVSIIRAQARLMDVVDKNDWSEAFEMVKEEIQHQRDELLQNATLEDTLRMAEDTGEDIEAFARRTGASLEDIALTFENMRGDKINL